LIKTECDNSYKKSRRKSETTATLIMTNKMKKKGESMFMDSRDVERCKKKNLMDVDGEKSKRLKRWIDLPLRSGNEKLFKLTVVRCDNSYKIIGVIRTAATHLVGSNLIAKMQIDHQKMLKERWKFRLCGNFSKF
jgi:hypothetical protein